MVASGVVVPVSLLDKGRDSVQIYLSYPVSDPDGNTVYKLSDTPIETLAVIQLQSQSGTSARRAEQQSEGFESEEIYRLRLPRSFTTTLDSHAVVVWRGQTWAVDGKPKLYNGSDRMAHVDYGLKRR
jgi:hypothetical protein